ncbi:MAG: sulfatase [Bacteroidales bacterium]|nr:sulfatase [Bacteroidales bacterium]
MKLAILRELIKLSPLYLLVSVFTVSILSCSRSITESHPNLLIIYPDQMRAHAMGFMNQDPVITPTLDELSKTSLVLTHAVANNPVCSPSRAMLMTGRYPFSNNVTYNCISDAAHFNIELQDSERCWSDVLSDEGYELGYIGKWHLDAPRPPYVKCKNNYENFAWNEWCPPHRRHGFNFWYAYGTYDYHNRPLYWDTDAGRDEFHLVDEWGPVHEADMAIRYIQNENARLRDPDKPFALVVAMNPPHDDGEGLYEEVPQKYVDLYSGLTYKDLITRANVLHEGGLYSEFARKQTKNYFAMVSGVDEQLGRILKALTDKELDKNTIVLFISDHGNCVGNHDHHGKSIFYEESMRIPFLIRWPDIIKPRHDDLLISIPDIYPTLLELMGFMDKIPADVEGRSHASVFLTGEGERPESQLYLSMPLVNPAIGKRGVRTHRYTLAVDRSYNDRYNYYLYDNQNDPYQLNNIAADNPEVVRILIKEELEPWLEKTSDPWTIARSPEK